MKKIATGLFAGLPIVAFACAGCGSDGGASAGGLRGGSTQGVLGTKITLNVSWPSTALDDRGSGTLSLWLLLRYAVDGNGAVAGTVETCGMQMPAFPYSTMSRAPALGGGPLEQLQITIPAGSWDGTPTTPITGTQGGSSVGSTFTIDPVVTLFGLKPASALASAAKAWPASATDLVMSDLTYADGGAYQAGVGEPGILAVFLGTPPDVLPLASIASSSPRVDELWLVLRTQFSLHGTVLSSTAQAGTVEVDTLDSHVVGCHLAEGGACTADQGVFLDQDRSWFNSFPASGSFRGMPMVDAGCRDVLDKLP